MALQRLKEAAEKAKMELSTTVETEVNLPFITADASGPKHLNIKVTRSRLEALIADLLENLEHPCRTALKDAALTTNQIDEVILVGGMTRMPAVQERVRAIFGKDPNKSVNPDEVVALGAAIQGAVLAGDLKDVLLLDVTPLSLGIETLGGVMTRLIEKNTTIPAKKSELFSTAEDNQPAVSIHVLQGEREMAADNKTLGRFELMGIQPAPRGTPQIEVTFDIDANGIVSVSAKDQATGKAQSIQITASSGLSREEIDRLVKDAQLNAAADQEKKELVQARNAADALIYSVEKSINDLGPSLDSQSRSRAESSIAQLKQTLQGEDAARIRQMSEELNHVAHAISQAAYSQHTTGGPSAPHQQAHRGASKDDDVVDADFEEVA
jgi:molecular chaperone DnaK